MMFLTITSHAINHSEEISKADQWAQSFGRSYPILIFNRDEMAYLFLKNGAVSDSKEHEDLRIDIIGQYVKEKVGIELTKNDLSNIEVYLYTLTGSATALPLWKESKKEGYKLCSVFPNPPNGNDRIETERILGLQQKKAYDKGEDFSQLTQKMTYEEMYLFSLYHEVSHCLDQKFMPKAIIAQEDPHAVHVSESFAETLAYLSLVERLGKDVAKSRVFYRTIFSRRVGEYFAKNPSVGFGDSNVTRGGIVYFLAPVLLEAYSQVAFREIKPSELSSQALALAAEDIVDRKALQFRSVAAIFMGLSEGFETAIKDYATKAFSAPELFSTAYQELIVFFEMTNTWLAQAFDSSILFEDSKAIAPALGNKSVCESLKNEKDFYDSLNSYREIINASPYSVESRQEAYMQLTDITKYLGSYCAEAL
jgi:hypothetical protein